MSRLALTPTNVPASASDITTPTLRTGDLYYNTTTGLMVYNGTAWTAVSATGATSELDAGAWDGTAPYNGGEPDSIATQSFEGGTP